MTLTPTAWKRLALGSLTLIVLLITLITSYVYLWPRVLAGQQAINYLTACVQADVCPSGAKLDELLAAKAAARASTVTNTTTPPPPPAEKAK